MKFVEIFRFGNIDKLLFQFVFVSAFLFTYSYIAVGQIDVCRTPSGRRAVIFEPCAYDIWDVSGVCWLVSTEQGYYLTGYIQVYNPGTNPSVTLQDFIDEMVDSSDIGILYIHSHGDPDAISLEWYIDNDEGEEARDSAWYNYIHRDENPIDSTHIFRGHEPGCGHCIGLNRLGLQYYRRNLGGTLVYTQCCFSAALNSDWKALVALGYDNYTCGWAGSDTFFRRMNGTKDRGSERTNKRREAGDAADSLIYECEYQDSTYLTRLIFTRNETQEKVVLSPIVIKHKPRKDSWSIPDDGFIKFDCVMDTTSAIINEIVQLIGTSQQLTDIRWTNNRRIQFEIPHIPEEENDCCIIFRVNPEKAISSHNGSQLDGNTNPGEDFSGIGPNRDEYSWTCLSSQDGAWMGFEDSNAVDGHPVVSTIEGVEFVATGTVYWEYYDRRIRENIYPGLDDVYWVEGKFGVAKDQGYGPEIRFVGQTATSVCLSASTHHDTLYLRASNIDSILVDEDITYQNSGSHTMDPLKVSSDSIRISYVYLYPPGWVGTWWIIDNLAVVGLSSRTRHLLPEYYKIISGDLFVLDLEEEDSLSTNVRGNVDSLRVIVNCYDEDMPEDGLRLKIFDADSKLVIDEISTKPPIQPDVIPDPMPGEWTSVVSAVKSEDGECPVSIYTATYHRKLLDCFIDGEDIRFFPEKPARGNVISIFADIHCNDELEFSEYVDLVLIKCYLGGPETNGEQIDTEEYGFNMQPGSSSNVYFAFDSAICEEGKDCDIYIRIDPENELEEYNEGNNVAMKKVVFSE